jgi:amino acid adenylation domain-containing protein
MNKSEPSEQAPLDPLRAVVRQILASTIGVQREEIDLTRNLLDLGLDSLAALEFRQRLDETFGTAPEPSELLGSTTGADICDFLAQALPSPRPPTRTDAGQEQGGLRPLSWGERALWFEYERDPAMSAYHIGGAVRIVGIEVGAMRRAFDRLFARHPSLQNTFGSSTHGPFQRTGTGPSLPTTEYDATEWSEARLVECLDAEWNRPFDLTAEPPARARLYRRSATETVVLFVLHHIAADFRSLEILVEEWIEFCHSETTGKAPTLSPSPDRHADYLTWYDRLLSGSEGDRLRRYWQGQLAGEPTPLAWPTEVSRPVQPGNSGAQQVRLLDADLTASVKALAHAAGTTPFVVFLSAFEVVLYRYTQQQDIRVGTSVAVRPTRDFDTAVGYFANTLVLRSKVDGNLDVSAFLGLVRATTLAALDHAAYPFALLVQDQRQVAGGTSAPLFQTMFVSYGFGGHTAGLAAAALQLPGEQVRWGNWPVETIRLEGSRYQCDLTLTLGECGAGAALSLEYNTALFDPATIDRLAGHYETVLRGIVRDPSGRVADLPLLTPGEEDQFERWNTTATAYPEPHILHSLVESQVSRNPDAIAVIDEGRSFSYSELDRWASHIARSLTERGTGRGDRVALVLGPRPEMVAGILGVLKAGAAYVPVHPEDGEQRIRTILEDSRPVAVLTTPRWQADVPPGDYHVLALTDHFVPAGADGPNARGPTVEPDDPAYLIYTSGSTGRPKGVVISHRAICNRLLWMQNQYPLAADDRVLQKTPYTFDVSVWELFLPLIAGVPMVLGRPGGHRDPSYLARLIREQRVTMAHFVPPVLRAFLDEPGIEPCSPLRQVFSSGEVLAGAVRDLFFRHLPKAALHNLYGPTEAAVDVTFWACNPSDTGDHVPIGRPITNTQAHVLDPWRNQVPVGVSGELYLTGTGLALGYWGNPTLTNERFVTLRLRDGREVRAYRTGDCVRFRPDGNLDFLGRFDDQVKIRGVRVEPAEVEATLRRHPRVVDCVVVAVSPGDQGPHLVAYVVPGVPPPDAAELRDFLRKSLTAPLVPGRFTFLDALPMTTSGKVNRAALPPPSAIGEPPEQPTQPWRTPEEELLARVWREVLGVDRVWSEANFFELGGDSLRSLQLRAEILRAGYELTFADLFAYPTVRDLAPRLRRMNGPPAERPLAPFALLPEERAQGLKDQFDAAFPLSRLQEGLLFHSQQGGDYEIYVLSLTIRAALDEGAMRTALASLVRRHEMLRVGYDLSHLDQPVQCVHRSAVIPLEVRDLIALDHAAQEMMIDGWIEQERTRRFDWTAPPLIRLRADRRALGVFQLTVSHPLFDGWSLMSLLVELLADYGARLRGLPAPDPPPPALSYASFVAAELAAITSPVDREFWQTKLAGPAAVPQRRSDHSMTRTRREVPVPDAVAWALRDLARSSHAPLKSVLLAVHLRVLGLLTDRAEVSTGLITNGRAAEPDGDRVVGLFLNTIPLGVRLGGETWREAARVAFRAEQEIWPHRRYPFSEIRKLAGGTPFESVFNFVHFHNYDGLRGTAAPEMIAWKNPSDFTLFPFAVYFVDDPLSARLLLYLDYDARTFPREQIDRTAGYFSRALACAARTPDSPACQADLLSAEERAEQQGWNATARRFALPERPVHRLIEVTAGHQPDAPAVLFGDGLLTYRELDSRANRLAARLRSLGVSAEEPVGLAIDRGPDLVVALLGVLKSGGAFVPLGADWPAERLGDIIGDCGLRFVVANRSFPATRTGVTVVPVTADATDGGTAECPTADDELDRLAYVVYTSGSTGRPKGVEVTHAGLRNALLGVAEEVRITADDTWLALTALSFDISILELLLPLVTGARVVIARDDQARDSRRLAQLLNESRCTVAQATPSMWRLAIDGGWSGSERVRVLCGGEPLARGLADQLLTRASVVWNLYGPTEASIWASVSKVIPGAEEPPIGHPLANTSLVVLGEAMRLLPGGTAGELYIGGEGVARGYRNRPQLTAERFFPDPFSDRPRARLYRTGDLCRFRADGEVEFLGRLDGQVKVRGFRVELSAIEARLIRHPDVRAAAVTTRTVSVDDQRLSAYVVAVGHRTPTAGELASFLAVSLPPYMIPNEFFLVSELPLTPNGKLDRASLAAVPGAALLAPSSFDEPQGETEQRIAAVWRDALGRNCIGRDDSFFLLGGHSLLALRVCLHLEREFGRRAPAAVLFEYPTIAALARFLDADGPERAVEAAGARARFRKAKAADNLAAVERRRGSRIRPPEGGSSHQGGHDEPNGE